MVTPSRVRIPEPGRGHRRGWQYIACLLMVDADGQRSSKICAAIPYLPRDAAQRRG